MSLIPFISLFILLALAIGVFGYLAFAKPSNMLDQLVTSTSVDIHTTRNEALEGASATGITKIFESIGRLLPYSPADIKVVKQSLGAAGFRSPHAPFVFLGMKVLTCALLLFTAVAIRERVAKDGINRIIFPIAAAVGGYLLPGLLVRQKTKKRQEQLRLGLPDVLDLLVICTEAGCALDKAIVNVAREFKTFHPIISEELTLVTMEMLAGNSRMDALRNFALRTGEDELKKLVAILIQTDRFGTSVADALRTQSDSMRIQRRQNAEERAGKVGVKLVFPIFFFCMPALMIIVAGPGMLQLFKTLLPALNSIN